MMGMNPKRESLLAACLSRDLPQNKRSMMQMASVKNNCNGYKQRRRQIAQSSSKLLANETTNNSEAVASTTIKRQSVSLSNKLEREKELSSGGTHGWLVLFP
jgi:hypothetical protein